MVFETFFDHSHSDHILHLRRHQLFQSALKLCQRNVSKRKLVFEFSNECNVSVIRYRLVCPAIGIHAGFVILNFSLVKLGSVVYRGLGNRLRCIVVLLFRVVRYVGIPSLFDIALDCDLFSLLTDTHFLTYFFTFDKCN